MNMPAGSYGTGSNQSPSTNSVDARKQPTVRDNGLNPSNKHWKSKAAGNIIPPIGSVPSQRAANTNGGTVRLNAGMTKRFGGNPVGKLGKVGY